MPCRWPSEIRPTTDEPAESTDRLLLDVYIRCVPAEAIAQHGDDVGEHRDVALLAELLLCSDDVSRRRSLRELQGRVPAHAVPQGDAADDSGLVDDAEEPRGAQVGDCAAEHLQGDVTRNREGAAHGVLRITSISLVKNVVDPVGGIASGRFELAHASLLLLVVVRFRATN